MHIVSRQQLITQSDYKNTSYYRYMQALEHEVFHHVFHHQGANRSHKYPSAEFKFLRMFYNIFGRFFIFFEREMTNFAQRKLNKQHTL